MKNIRILRISNYASNYAVEAAKGSPITTYASVTLLLNEAQIVELTQMQTIGRITLALKPIVAEQEGLKEESVTPVIETTTPSNP